MSHDLHDTEFGPPPTDRPPQSGKTLLWTGFILMVIGCGAPAFVGSISGAQESPSRIFLVLLDILRLLSFIGLALLLIGWLRVMKSRRQQKK